jgi:prephenate dehydrogenase
MAEISVAILGLGRLGASFGLALDRYNNAEGSKNRFEMVGYDSVPATRDAAKKLGAVPNVTASLVRAVADKDLVIVAVPYAETRRTFRDIAEALRPGAVVLDLAPLKGPSNSWATEYFPDGVHLVGVTAVINPALLWDGLDDVHHARPDLFDNGDFLLAPSPKAAPDAVELVTQVAEIVGAGKHFVDPIEHDGLIAATETLPALLGAAAFRAMTRQQGWSEAQRMGNPNFGRLTHHLLDTHPDDLRDHLLNNRESLLRQLDGLLTVLNDYRDTLADNDADAIEAALVEDSANYEAWVGRRANGKWDPMLQDNNDANAMGNLLSGMLGGFLADRIQGKNSREN